MFEGQNVLKILYATKIWPFPISKYQFDTFSRLKHVFPWINYAIWKWYEQRVFLYGTWYDNETRMSDFQRYWTSDVSGSESGLRNIQQKSHSDEFFKSKVKSFRKSTSDWSPWIPDWKWLISFWHVKLMCLKLISSSLGEKP